MKFKLGLVLLLLAADIASALGVVYMRHESRRLAVNLGELQDVRDEAIAEWSRLQLEQAWLADASQVERKAREQLDMKEPEATRILVVGE